MPVNTMLTLKQHAYQVILERLTSGAVQPGSRLSDDSIAREIGISRAPVREALGQLASQGLVDHSPRRGAFVRSPDRREMEQLYEARLALEGFAAGKAALAATAKDLVELEEINRRLRATVELCRRHSNRVADRRLLDRFLRADLDFHEKILQILGNDRITTMVQECKLLTRVFVHTRFDHDIRLMAITYLHHSRVLRAIRRRDAAAAVHWMNHHLEKAAKAVLDRYQPAQ